MPNPPQPTNVKPAVLEAHGLECVRGHRRLFHNLHCRLEPGETLQIHGENGAGKTSLLRILCGLSLPESGEVHWNDTPIQHNRTAYYRALAYCGHTTALKLDLTPLENLDAAHALSATPPTLSSRDALQRLALHDYADQPCRTLSAGQRQRVTLARILSRRGGIWILDEPATALDQHAVKLLEQILAEQLAHGGMIIFTSHRELMFNATQPQQLHLNATSPNTISSNTSQ